VESRRFGRRGRRALVTGTGLIVATVMPGFLTASLAPRIRGDFSFGDSALGVAIALFYVVSAAGSVPAGWAVDRIGAGRSMGLAAGACALSCAGVALLAGSATSFTALLLVAGLGNAMGSPCVSTMLRAEVAIHRQGLAFGAQQSGATLGALLAGLALPAVAIPLGWRWAFVAAGTLALLAAWGAPRGGAAAAATRPGGRRRGGRRPGLGPVHALGLAAVLASAAGVGFVSFLVTYAVDSGMSEGAAGLLFGAVSLMATASRIGVGLFADRVGQEPLRPVAAMLAVSAVGYLLLIVGEPAPIAVAALLAGALGWAWPGGLNLAVIQRSPEAPAWAVGVMMTGLFVGAVAGPLVVGVLAEHEAFTGAWIFCASLALLASATIAATRRLEA
jgi:MFS family permease